MFRCRACGSADGEIVLDLGHQPTWDSMPSAGTPLPDPVYPLRMWWCRACTFAQLEDDADARVEEIQAVEPQAMLDQTALSLERMGEIGLFRAGRTFLEYGSPHGESWHERLLAGGLAPVHDGPADVIVDVYGLLHEPDQSAALAERAARLAPGGTLVVQMLSLATVLRDGQWYDLRHGHYGYWSVPALDTAVRRLGLGVHRAWRYPLSGGTVLLTITADPCPDAATADLIADEIAVGVIDAHLLRTLQSAADTAVELRDWLAAEARAGRTVYGYGAASRAVPLVCRSGVDAGLLPAIADASPAKQGRRMPGTDIPIISPEELVAREPDRVLLFVAEMLAEVRAAVPGVEAAGGTWVVRDPHPRAISVA